MLNPRDLLLSFLQLNPFFAGFNQHDSQVGGERNTDTNHGWGEVGEIDADITQVKLFSPRFY